MKRASSLRILYGLLAGAAIGLVLRLTGPSHFHAELVRLVIDPIGEAFLRGLMMVVVPLVLSSLTVGIVHLGSARRLGTLGWRLGAFYALTSLIAILIGQFLVTLLKPGVGIPPELMLESQAALAQQVSGLMERSSQVGTSLWPGMVSTIIPRNIPAALADGNMLSIIFVSVIFGSALLVMEKESTRTTVSVLETFSSACVRIIGWIMRLAPYAVAALMISAVMKFGVEILLNILKYIGVVVAGYTIHLTLTYGAILKYVLKRSPMEFFKLASPALATAFGTSSSNATMPMTIHTLETRFGVSPTLTRFSVPMGATVNMDGTALFEAVAALFIAQIFGVEISLFGQFTLVTIVLLTSIGVAGVPGGSIPILMSAMAMLGIPPEGIALVLGVDRLLDMGRTLVNVTGDMVAALYLEKTATSST